MRAWLPLLLGAVVALPAACANGDAVYDNKVTCVARIDVWRQVADTLERAVPHAAMSTRTKADIATLRARIIGQTYAAGASLGKSREDVIADFKAATKREAKPLIANTGDKDALRIVGELGQQVIACRNDSAEPS